MKIYVASSWRNTRQQEVVTELRATGHEVYDFKHPNGEPDGFHWSNIDPHWKSWTPEQYIEALKTEAAEEGYNKDFEAMEWADACVLVMPCGRSAHLEAGWFAGKGRPVYVLLSDGEPELMYKMTTELFSELMPLLMHLRGK